MKTVVSVACPPDGRRRTSILICVIFIIAFPILASSHEQKNAGHGSTYASKSEDKMEFSKNSKESKISLADDENDDSGVSEVD